MSGWGVRLPGLAASVLPFVTCVILAKILNCQAPFMCKVDVVSDPLEAVQRFKVTCTLPLGELLACSKCLVTQLSQLLLVLSSYLRPGRSGPQLYDICASVPSSGWDTSDDVISLGVTSTGEQNKTKEQNQTNYYHHHQQQQTPGFIC